MMKKVSFTEMKNGTKEDYLFLDKHEKDFASKTLALNSVGSRLTTFNKTSSKFNFCE